MPAIPIIEPERSNMLNSTRLNDAVQQAFYAGWTTPMPLPKGKKAHPPKDWTGNRPEVPAVQIAYAWESADDDSNLGVRIPENVLVLDIDHYQNKRGADTLKALVEQRGPLPKTFSSTRRGADSPARQLFYRVEAGKKWDGSAGDSIDILQHTHRYAVIYPSVVDGQQYRWYDPEGNAIDHAPNISELAELPSVWQDKLKQGALKDFIDNGPKEDFGDLASAYAWLADMAPGYAEEISPGFQTGLDNREHEFKNDAHDPMVSAHSWAIKYALGDGVHGLEAVLKQIKEWFTARREDHGDLSDLEGEHRRSLVGAVNKVRGDIERGRFRPAIRGAEITSLHGAKTAREKFDELVEQARQYAREYPQEPAAGKLFAEVLPNASALVSDKHRRGTFEEELFDVDKQRQITPSDIVSVVNDTMKRVIEQAYYPVTEDDDKAEAANKRLYSVYNFASSTRNHKALQIGAVSTLRDAGRTVDVSDIDADPAILGLPDGRVLDLNLATKDWTLTSLVRERKPNELVTMRLSVDVDECARALQHRRTHYTGEQRKTPAERFLETAIQGDDVRAVAQKLLGYAMYGKMDSAHRNLPVFYGRTSSGKTVLTDLIKTVAGDYAGSVGIEALTKSDDGPNSALYAVIHTRFLFLSELSSAQHAASEKLKALTSTEGVKATPKNSNKVVETKTITPVIVTNDAPSMRIDDAMERRLVVVPMNADPALIEAVLPPILPNGVARKDVFNVETTQDWKQDPENKGYTLEWLVAGYVSMVSDHLVRSELPPAIIEACEDFAGQADPLADWFNSYLKFTNNSEDFVSNDDLQRHFDRAKIDAPFPGFRKLKRLMLERGANDDRTNQTRGYSCVKLRLP